MEHIKFHVVIEEKTVSYAKYMWDMAKSLCSDYTNVSINLYSMNTINLSYVEQFTPNVMLVNVNEKQLKGSFGHGIALNYAVKNFCNGINVIADSDTCIVTKGWDVMVRNMLKQYGVIGAPYEDIGGFSSGYTKTQTYKKIPNAVWAAFSSRYDWSGLDFTPDKQNTVHIVDDTHSKIYNLPVGYNVLLDVGWRLPAYIHKINAPYFAFEHVKPSTGAKVIVGLKDYNEEFQNGGIPVVVHQRGSSNNPFRNTPLSAFFYNAVDKKIASEKLQNVIWYSF